MILESRVLSREQREKLERENAARAKDLAEATVVELDGTVMVNGEVSADANADGASVGGDVGVSEPDSQDLGSALARFDGKLPKDKPEIEAARELYDEMSDEYKRYIAEKVKALPIVRYKRRAPFTEDEKKIIAAGLMSRTPHYKIAQTLRCSYSKLDKAILEDEFLKELAAEAILREKEEVEEGLDDCIRARNPAVLMWKAAKIMPEKYGDQIRLDAEDDTRLVIGAIPEEDIAEADRIVEDMKDKVPVVPTSALIEANEIQAERQAAGFGVSAVPLSATPATPAVSPPPGDPRFRPLVSAGEMNQVDEGGHVVSPATQRPIHGAESESDPGPDNYGTFSGDDIGEFGGESWI